MLQEEQPDSSNTFLNLSDSDIAKVLNKMEEIEQSEILALKAFFLNEIIVSRTIEKQAKTMTEQIIKNPITNWIKESVNTSVDRLNFAVPFLSSFSLSILNHENTAKISDKRIVTRFDESGIITFDLPTLRALLDLGFKIRFDNSIHLKLYIADCEVYVTSSNLTKAGFEDNVELTIKVSSSNVKTCAGIFDEIWSNSENNKLSYELIECNWAKYDILRKRESYSRKDKSTIKIRQLERGDIDIHEIITKIFDIKDDIIVNRESIIFRANEKREETKENLRKGFDKKVFYVSKGHELRRENLFYDFVYGFEKELAGTGLREAQFQSVFEHPDFKKVIEYLYPQILEMTPWNFSDQDELLEFCNGIFDFDIPQYKESIPIRLASYFYPEQFLPIFKLDHLDRISESFGLSTNAKTKGERFFSYNLFLAEKMKTLPCSNYIKAHIAYQVMYVIEVYKRLRKGENYDEIYNEYSKSWKQRMIRYGREILTNLKIVK